MPLILSKPTLYVHYELPQPSNPPPPRPPCPPHPQPAYPTHNLPYTYALHTPPTAPGPARRPKEPPRPLTLYMTYPIHAPHRPTQTHPRSSPALPNAPGPPATYPTRPRPTYPILAPVQRTRLAPNGRNLPPRPPTLYMFRLPYTPRAEKRKRPSPQTAYPIHALHPAPGQEQARKRKKKPARPCPQPTYPTHAAYPTGAPRGKDTRPKGRKLPQG